MDHIETPYDVEVEFIECKICEKSIRGETLYKIHMTTPGHLKKEDSLLAQGVLVGRPTLPKFRDISHYLDYLKLDEPIIGLGFLKEIPSNDLQAGIKYVCNLCTMMAFLPEMVHHVIGRKHRQKYVEMIRPDLVTWDTQSVMSQGGRVIRAKAEIIERQDGRGIPVPLPKMGNQGSFNNSRVSPRQRQNWDRPTEQIPTGQVAPHRPEFNNNQCHSPNQRTYPSDPQNKAGFQPENSYRNRSRPLQWEDTVGHSEKFVGPDNHVQYEFSKDFKGRAPFEPGDRAPMQDYQEKLPCGAAQCGEYYQENDTPYEKSYPERRDPNELYSERHDFGQIPHLNYTEGEKEQWSREQQPSSHGNMYRENVQDFWEPQPKSNTFSPSVNSEQGGRIFRDYHHKKPSNIAQANYNPHCEEAAPSSSHRQMGVTRTISDIPEPFRRFLTGATGDSFGKRKRKSRFSDATPEELEMTKKMFNSNCGQPSPHFSNKPSAQLRCERSGMEYSNLYSGTADPQSAESYRRGGSQADSVFDLLKNIEVENAEQADFLKNKLCGLLKEFKSKKMEQVTQNNINRPGIFRNYSDSSDPQLPRQSLYERSPRQDTDHHELMRDRHEHRPGQKHQEYPQPLRAELRQSNRGHYGGKYETARSSHLDERPHYYPERFQETLRCPDYQPAVKEFYDSSLPMEQGSRRNWGPRHSNSLDKIASTLLELVSKK